MYQRKVPITRIKKNEIVKTTDSILIEKPVDIIINSKPLANIICLPKNLKELAIGFLYSIGIINDIQDIKLIKIDDSESRIRIELGDSVNFDSEELNINTVSRVIDTTCGISSPWRDIIKKKIHSNKGLNLNNLKIKKESLFQAIKIMQKETTLFKDTGGCHGCAIFNANNNHLLSIMEDIGRHNAIDKAIGDLLLKNISFENVFLTSTGRLTGDSVLKAIRAQIPIVASISAAIESGIRLAFSYGITLIGFVRGTRMNIYTHPERILN